MADKKNGKEKNDYIASDSDYFSPRERTASAFSSVSFSLPLLFWVSSVK